MAKQIKATDIFEKEDVFAGIRKSAEDAIVTLGKFKTELQQTADELKKTIGGATVGDTKSINELITATQKANEVKEKTVKIDQEQEKLRKLAIQSEREELKLKKDLENQAIKQQKAKEKEIKQAQQEQSIYAQTSKRLNDLRKAYKDLAIQNKENTAEGQKLIAEITELDTKLKKVDATVGQHQRNVGNYEGATMSLRAELRKLTQELANMDEADPRFQQMAQRAGELRDRMQDTQGVIQATAGTAVENLAGSVANAGQIGIAAFQGMESAMVLLGVESENVMKAMLRLQALAGLGDALRTLGGLGDTLTQIRAGIVSAAQKMGILTTATVAQGTATNATAAATSRLQLTMKAIPFALIATAVIALIANFSKITALFDNLSFKTKVLNDTMNAYGEAAKNVVKETTEVKASFQLAREGVISKEEALDKYNSVLGATFGTAKDLNEAEKLYAEKTAAYVKATGLRAQADAIFQKVAEERVKAMLAHREAAKTASMANDDFLSLTGSLSGSLKKVGYEANKEATELEKLAVSLLKEAESLENSAGIRSEYDQKMDKSTDKQKKNAKDIKNINDEKVDLIQKIEELENKYLDGQLTNAQQEELMIRDKYFYLIELAKKYNIDITTLQLALDKELSDLRQKAIDKQKQDAKKAQDDLAQQEEDFYEEYRKATQTDTQNQIDAVNEKYFYLIETAKKYNLDTKVLEKKQKEEIAEILKKSDDKTAKEELDRLKKQTENRNEWAKFATDYFVKMSNERIAQLDKEIAAAEKQQDTLRELAANGNINARESLAENQRIIDEANRKKAQEERRKQMIELVSGVYQTYNQKVAANAENPLMETIRDTVLLQQFANTLLGNMPTFFDGTENTGTHGEGVDGKGGFHAILHPNERVVPKSLNEKIGSLSNEQLAKVAQEYQNGKLITGTQPMSAIDLSLLVNKMDELTHTIKNKPETNIELGEITSSVMEIVKTTKQGNTLKTNRFKIRK